MKNVAIFASGSGTNAENIARYFSKSETVKVAVVLSNNKNVGVHARVNKLGIPSFVFSRDEFVEGTPVLAKLAEYQVDLIVLAGFMNKISDALLGAYPGKIINIHPALLPKHGGKGMYGMHVHEAVVAAGEKESGITIHYINENYDEGDVIFQAECEVLPTDTPDEVATKVHALEYAHYPHVIEDLLK
ncbi:phosphoribosylglycinamide formyltransferase [Parabacteroides faecis]|uniref:Phosphoribosylglycinamide formyltransferase n=1 Tax=Parabacteroides faecis TaxID=1217282 RepID=A0ABR6KRX9_9BACT|nr:phosphoribosylglycinamide formyltransferase [Parabacteroides faecis]MBB4624258.1 phosphoribosylglycinamide formyltransferase-1 [Parabacteroides faecis]GGK12435.1 phosphoribosylglycinamide formyltransferase [Parabacteroides faecis]